MKRRVKRLLVIAPVTVLGTAGLLAAVTAVRAAALPAYWHQHAAAPAAANAVRIVALGDSATVGDVLRDQFDPAMVASADLVIVQTSNDAQQRIPLPTYRSDLERLLTGLPADRTVLGDVPLLPGRVPYQQILDDVAAERGFRVARSAEVFRRDGRRLDVFSALPPHLNDRGYGYWASAFVPQTRDVLR